MKNTGNALLTFFIAMVTLSLILSSCTPNLTPPSTAVPSDTPMPLATASPTATVVPALNIGSTWVRSADGTTMVYVPEGDFNMGYAFTAGGMPAHLVYLDAYWIDKTEVTNAMYAKCVQDGACQKPHSSNSWTRQSYYNDPQYADYPVIWVRWGDASAFCSWAGARLPTEAEWEKASHGIGDEPYPWGYSLPNNNLLNMNFNVGDTTAVGSYPSGASPYGALDMAGNVWEFVADWFSETYYAEPPASNPQGPSTGKDKVLRGGSYSSTEYLILARNSIDVMVGALENGFRCARSANALVAGITPTTTPTQPTLADFFLRCPTAAEVADINAKLILAFEDDPTAGTLVCTAAAGSADLTSLEKKAYQTIIIMKYLDFDQPLPWTDLQLYDWFTSTVRGINFTYGPGPSSCCIDGMISIRYDWESYILNQDVWVEGFKGVEISSEPGTGGSWGGGLMLTTSVYIHEARHNENHVHRCKLDPKLGVYINDLTLAEMGASGVQYFFYYWLAVHSDPAFLRAPGDYPDLYREVAMYDAYRSLKYDFCNVPTPTPGPLPTLVP